MFCMSNERLTAKKKMFISRANKVRACGHLAAPGTASSAHTYYDIGTGGLPQLRRQG